MRKQMKLAGCVLSAALLLSACGGNEAPKAGSEPAGDAGANALNKDPYEVVVAFPIIGSIPKDIQLVQDEINKISRAKLNTTMKLLPLGSDWANQINLMLSSGEKLDLMATYNYSADVSMGRLLPINELIDQHGQGIKTALGDYYKATFIKGKSYGVPSVRDFAQDYGLLIRKDLLVKTGIDTSKMKSLDDLEPLLKALKETIDPSMVPLTNKTGNSVLGTFSTRDSLGDDLGVLLGNGQDNLKVVNWYETPEYAGYLKTIRRWYESGYILKDAVQNQEAENAVIKAGKAAAVLGHQKPGFETQASHTTQMEMATVKLVPPIAKTSTVTNVMWGVAATSNKPDRAVQFLNLMYSDKDIVNLLDWGIEGKHYAKGSDGLIDYPQGVDKSNTGWGLNMGWMFGNQFLAYVWKGDSPDLWKKTEEFNRSAMKSKALGFTFDASPVKTEVTAVSNVINQYRRGLECGVLDPDKELPNFISKLKDAGIDKIVAEKQKQLDQWSKEQ
ncbi:Bacterial extracellular solute-binding protein [Paenibacillus konkukensis]|uniref:Bacterial extracellular solute-binding protein n=1 Tax=Paenibacillus konkukensis TaxID=2020716 RepID=A0ABY4RUI1_9BACL|nr:ABC transporter substrate-binding protein [Paenibacillus konkukensis]UQZ85640.1 Bacterial extracellular solute-binding protein [Paenibacillus konkukensis]